MAVKGFTDLEAESLVPLLQELIEIAVNKASNFGALIDVYFRKLIMLCKKDHCRRLSMHFLERLWFTEHSKLHARMLGTVRDLYGHLKPEHCDFLSSQIKAFMGKEEN